MKITTAALKLAPETIEEAHYLRDAIDATIDAIDPAPAMRDELKGARYRLHHWNEFTDPVTLSVAALDEVHTGLCMLAEWSESDGDAEVEMFERLALNLEGALTLAGELGQLLGRGSSEARAS